MIMIICRRQSGLCREVVYIEKSIAETFQLVNFKPIIVNKVSPMPSFVYQCLIQDSVPPFTILFNDVDFKSTTYLKIINGSLVDILQIALNWEFSRELVMLCFGCFGSGSFLSGSVQYPDAVQKNQDPESGSM